MDSGKLTDKSKPTWCTVYPDRECFEGNCCISDLDKRVERRVVPGKVIIVEYIGNDPSVE